MPQLPQGVIQLIAEPPFGILSRELGFTLTAGLTSIQRPRGPVHVDAFGLSFSFVAIPASFGSAIGVVTDYEERICQFAPRYTDLSGHDFYGGFQDVFHEGEFYFFPQAFPTAIDVFVTVGCVVTQYWLVAL